MNQSFSFPRFARLHRWLWAIKGRTYTIGMLALLGLVALRLLQPLGYGKLYFESVQDGNMLTLVVLSMLLVAGLGSDVFSMLYRQESAITYLMIPASQTEKFWLSVAYCVGALVLFVLVFHGLESLVFPVANSRLPASQPDHYLPTLHYFFQAQRGDGQVLKILAYALTLALSVAILGSFFFRKGVLIRNVGGFLVLTVAGIFLYRGILGLWFSGYELGAQAPFLDVYIGKNAVYQHLIIPTWITYLGYGTLLGTLWVTARIRFNEIQR